MELHGYRCWKQIATQDSKLQNSRSICISIYAAVLMCLLALKRTLQLFEPSSIQNTVYSNSETKTRAKSRKRRKLGNRWADNFIHMKT
ncbi:hypothetical protein T05_309 [Trichinella murrelli]|uniref:Uncharacterized protein n=1 Tax=Trichinella murrelli TaxID=144512 RepID=A0A0V0UIS2_9BILA|nr:hypothetical protein T05_309 [Trichinella murrelli]